MFDTQNFLRENAHTPHLMCPPKCSKETFAYTVCMCKQQHHVTFKDNSAMWKDLKYCSSLCPQYSCFFFVFNICRSMQFFWLSSALKMYQHLKTAGKMPSTGRNCSLAPQSSEHMQTCQCDILYLKQYEMLRKINLKS